uniref:Protein kinase domain-containing protein n=1 Tax=viral metagenome TaxID=1070528 RepID=A0A6C0JHG4_9ZZZZ
MNSIFSLNEFDIYQDKKKHTIFNITQNNNSLNASDDSFNSLFNSIIKTKLINSATILQRASSSSSSFEKPNSEDIFSIFEMRKEPHQNNSSNTSNTSKSILFKALSIETFERFIEKQKNKNGTNKLTYNVLLNIIYSLSKQISYLLNKESKCFYKLDISNILVIDEQKFVYLSYEHLKDVKENKIHIYSPISKTSGYISPELQVAKSIPILVSYKTIFYSLGLLILHNISEDETDINELNKLHTINGTKLFYFLKRCLVEESDKRFLLYV